MKRLYDTMLEQHLKADQEMLFLSGPRQVGKTTSSIQSAENLSRHVIYLNWDDEDHRAMLAEGPAAIIQSIGRDQLKASNDIIVFDEIHKRPDWKNFLKGFYDSYSNDFHIIVTGSSRLDVYKQGGDSLMGRYFPYRMHPLSVAECLRSDLPRHDISKPQAIDELDFAALYEFGGFPKPYLKRNKQFSTRWQRLRKQQLLREDIRDVNVIHDLNGLQVLMDLLQRRSGQQLNYSRLAKLVRVSVDTITRWIEVLETFYYCYRIRPWSKNISRSLLKEPKVFLWDWSVVSDPGAKAENFIASHLLKFVHYCTDQGFGEYGLYYIRTTEKKEVDFVVTKNDKPWFLVEVKSSSEEKLNQNLCRFQQESGAEHAFQVAINMPYVDKDCFADAGPIIVPARTFLSQLV